MIQSNGCCGGHDGSLSFNKRLKALEKAITDYSDLVASANLRTDDLKAKKAEIFDASIKELDSTSIESELIKTKHIDADVGVFGTILADKLELSDPEIDVEYNNVLANSVHADFIEAKEGEFGTITAEYINIKGLVDMFNMKRLFINGKKALTNESTGADNVLTVGEQFRQADFMTALRPTWQGLPLALESDTINPFILLGIINDDSELPITAKENDVYFIQNHTDAVLGNVPAMALFHDNKWGYINYPGLDAYLTKSQYLDEQQALSARLDTDEAQIESVIGTTSALNNKVDELNETSEKLTEDLTKVSDELTEYIEETNSTLEELDEKKLEDAPTDGQFYGRKDGEWQTLSDSGTFVPSVYTSDDTNSSIINGKDGVVITSDKDMIIPTAENRNSMTKAAVNVEYLRKNLNLSRQSGASASSRYKLVMKKTPTGSYDLLHYETNDTLKTNLRGVGTGHWYSANYLWQLSRTSNANYMMVGAYDKEGNFHEATPSHLSINFATANTYLHTDLVGYHIDQYNTETQDMVYLPTYGTGAIFAFNNGEYVGMVSENDEKTPYQITGLEATEYQHVHGKCLRGSARILLVNNATADEQALKAFIIGIDNEPLSGKSITLAGRAEFGAASVASGKNYWWIHNNTTNQWQRITKDGGVASFIAQYNGSALPNTLFNSPNSYIELENGDCVFAVNDTTNFNTYFVWCHDSDDDNPVEAIRAPYYYAASASDKGNPWSAWFPFFETQNYLYFFQTVSATGNRTGDTNTAYTQNGAKTYTKIDKVSKEVQALTVPWSNGSREFNLPSQRVRTKGGYTWVFPFGEYNASSIQDMCLVFDPQGNAKTVNLGTGATINWFGSQNFYSMKLGGSPSWAYGMFDGIICGVDGKGTGFLLAPDFQHLLMFRGDGEFKVYSYSATDNIIPQGTAISTGVAQQGNHYYMEPLANGVVIEIRGTALTQDPAEGNGSKFVYLSDESTDEYMSEPFSSFVAVNDWNGWRRQLSLTNYTSQSDYTVLNRVIKGIIPPMNSTSGVYGRVCAVETPTGTSGSTIFLRDGEVNISNVSV